ncbi:hypothetical protein DPMN_109190 [Dreissena polymorpha]|uniref:Uncharacterized protein n=1 Tax=Dreissena polymorpha TaxID=45954 RepID=A0A9D4KAA3_DREPO|nr:hypothetical protein DPMN_109190 [Dreissena polymorpha]
MTREASSANSMFQINTSRTLLFALSRDMLNRLLSDRVWRFLTLERIFKGMLQQESDEHKEKNDNAAIFNAAADVKSTCRRSAIFCCAFHAFVE